MIRNLPVLISDMDDLPDYSQLQDLEVQLITNPPVYIRDIGGLSDHSQYQDMYNQLITNLPFGIFQKLTTSLNNANNKIWKIR